MIETCEIVELCTVSLCTVPFCAVPSVLCPLYFVLCTVPSLLCPSELCFSVLCPLYCALCTVPYYGTLQFCNMNRLKSCEKWSDCVSSCRLQEFGIIMPNIFIFMFHLLQAGLEPALVQELREYSTLLEDSLIYIQEYVNQVNQVYYDNCRFLVFFCL